MNFNPDTFAVSCLVHPSTYLNKILLCSKQGSMQLWNIKTNKMIYTFQGWSDPITAVEQAPAIDVVGVGLQSGKIIIHNLKFDETVMFFQQDWGPVTSIAFRTVYNMSGHVVWELQSHTTRTRML
ncbi:WD repeat-containing protein 36 [Exaiptasia diaphana]|nr:WD repeat-containing protein 36 [Exaiptasia diaphana]